MRQREEMATLRSSEQKAAGVKVWCQGLEAEVLPPGLGTAVCRDSLKSSSVEKQHAQVGLE